MEKNKYNKKKLQLLKLVIKISFIYSVILTLLGYFELIPHVEYRVEIMSVYAIINLILYYFIKDDNSKNQIIILNIALFFALIIFSTILIVYPPSDIRVIWFFFTIMIAYYVGGKTTGLIVSILSLILIFSINYFDHLNFDSSTMTSITIGIIFISQISNYFLNILDSNERELLKYQTQLEDMISEALQEITILNKEITDTQKEVVFTMGAIGESRSKETGNHVKRVAEYSKLFVQLLGMKDEEAELLRMASPMHDIGKIAIPDNILKKPGKLTNDEFDIMKTHSALGYEMLKHSNREILKTASIVAEQHHERWDGKGYPNGLEKENIHLFARITTIADVFDALGSHRVYKEAWSDDKIFNLFKEESGKQFDPNLMKLFFDNIDKFKAIREKFKDV